MSMKRKKYCDECGHLHLIDNYCHVYIDENSAYDVEEDYAEEAEEEDEPGAAPTEG